MPALNNELPTELLDVATLATYFGVNIRRANRSVAGRSLPVITRGHVISFDPDETKELVDAYRRQPGWVG